VANINNTNVPYTVQELMILRHHLNWPLYCFVILS